jgi:hypothetical protein
MSKSEKKNGKKKNGKDRKPSPDHVIERPLGELKDTQGGEHLAKLVATNVESDQCCRLQIILRHEESRRTAFMDLDMIDAAGSEGTVQRGPIRLSYVSKRGEPEGVFKLMIRGRSRVVKDGKGKVVMDGDRARRERFEPDVTLVLSEDQADGMVADAEFLTKARDAMVEAGRVSYFVFEPEPEKKAEAKSEDEESEGESDSEDGESEESEGESEEKDEADEEAEEATTSA